MTSLRLKPACLHLYPEFALACRRDAWCISHGSVAGFDEAQTRAWLDTLTREQPQGLLHLWRHHSPIGQLELAPAMMRQDGSQGGYLYLLYLIPDWRGRGLGRWLLEQALQRIRAVGSTSAELRYLPTHLTAERFYLRQGWRKEGRADERGQLLVKDLTPLMPPRAMPAPLAQRGHHHEQPPVFTDSVGLFHLLLGLLLCRAQTGQSSRLAGPANPGAVPDPAPRVPGR